MTAIDVYLAANPRVEKVVKISKAKYHPGRSFTALAVLLYHTHTLPKRTIKPVVYQTHKIQLINVLT